MTSLSAGSPLILRAVSSRVVLIQPHQSRSHIFTKIFGNIRKKCSKKRVKSVKLYLGYSTFLEHLIFDLHYLQTTGVFVIIIIIVMMLLLLYFFIKANVLYVLEDNLAA